MLVLILFSLFVCCLETSSAFLCSTVVTPELETNHEQEHTSKPQTAARTRSHGGRASYWVGEKSPDAVSVVDPAPDVCKPREAALQAVRKDDADEIKRLRAIGFTFDALTTISFPGGFSTDVSFAAYAAALGSFRVLENLLVNCDYNCSERTTPYTSLCRLSAAEHCQIYDYRRSAMIRLINATYSAACYQAFDTCTPSKSASAIDASGAVGTIKTLQASRARCDRHSYFVSVRFSMIGGYGHECGGVLIGPRFVLTAAHCVDDIPKGKDLIMAIGARSASDSRTSCAELPEIRTSIAVVQHRRWLRRDDRNSTGLGYDIALIKLNRRSRKPPIRLPFNQKLSSGDNLKFVGVGRKSRYAAFSLQLQIRQLPVANRSVCLSEYERTFSIAVLCAGGSSSGSFCFGDDGGPLFRSRPNQEDVLVGIAQRVMPGEECSSRMRPGLFANVLQLSSWLKTNMEKLGD